MLKKSFLLLLLLYSIFLAIHIGKHRNLYLWDFKTYYYGAKAYTAGLNPYDDNTLSQLAQEPIEIRYVYPPIPLLFFRFFSIVDYNTAFNIFLFFKFILLIGLIYLWRKFLHREEIDVFFYLFCLLAFNSTIFFDLRSGNVSIVENFLLWLGFYYFLKDKLLPSCILITAAATFKVTPILFLLLLLSTEDKKRHIYFYCSIIAFLFSLFLSYAITPGLFADFRNNLMHIFLQNERGLHKPSTFSLLEYLSKIFSDKTGIIISYKMQLGLFIVLIVTIILVSKGAYSALKARGEKDSKRIMLFLACLVYALILPRFKDYSYILLIVPTYFAIKRTRYVKSYPLLFVCVVLFTTTPLPGLKTFFRVLWEYSSLVMAYCAWGLYLYDIMRHSDRERNGCAIKI